MSPRDAAVKERGRRRWKKTSGYHGQARVENAFFRYTSIIGDSLRACSPAGRGTEVDLACNILNQMTGLGRGSSWAHVSAGSGDGLWSWTIVRRTRFRALGGPQVYKAALGRRQNGNAGVHQQAVRGGGMTRSPIDSTNRALIAS